MDRLPEDTRISQRFEALPAEFAPIIPLSPQPPTTEQVDWKQEAMIEAGALAEEDVEAIEHIYSHFYEQGFIGFLQRKIKPVVPEGSEETLAIAIADRIYQAKLSAILSTIQKLLIAGTGCTVMAIGTAIYTSSFKPEDALKLGVGATGVGVSAAIVALLEQPKKRYQCYSEAKRAIGQ